MEIFCLILLSAYRINEININRAPINERPITINANGILK